MTKHISAMDARKNLGEILEGVYYRGDAVVVERAGKPMGVTVTVAQFEQIERMRAEALAKLESYWSELPETGPIADAEEELLEEAQAVRHLTRRVTKGTIE